MNNEIEERFKAAVQYDARMSKTFCGYDTFPLVILSYLGNRLPMDAHVLDVGCGTGTSLLTYASLMPGWTLTGVDPAEAMINLARAKLEERGLSGRIQVHAGTIDAVPAAELFDGAALLLVEHLLPDDGGKLRLLQEIVRRLKPGGWLVLMGLHGDFSTLETQSALDAWQTFLSLQGFPDETREMFRRRATVEDSLVPEARIRDLLTEVGFVKIEPIYKLQLVGGWLGQRG